MRESKLVPQGDQLLKGKQKSSIISSPYKLQNSDIISHFISRAGSCSYMQDGRVHNYLLISIECILLRVSFYTILEFSSVTKCTLLSPTMTPFYRNHV